MTPTLALTALAGLALFSPAGEERLADSGPTAAELQAHYARVEVELLQADVSHLTEAQRAARRQVVHDLAAYRERADFGRNERFPHERKLLFVDDGGRRCAVAELLHCTGRDDMVERIASSSNHAFICELSGDAEFEAWLDSVGLSFDEAARIQGPGGGGGIVVGSSNVQPTRNVDNWDGPGDVVPGPGGAAVPGANAPAGPTASAPTTPIPGSTPATAAGAAMRPTTQRTNHEVGAEDWWTWWELHKLDYLRPNLIRNWVQTVTRPSDGYYPAKELGLVREDLKPVVLELMDDGDPQVRAAAALAFGRIAGDEAVGPLRAALEDPNTLVRERAILALGATGSQAAADLLLDLADDGKLSESIARVTPDARELALIAIGIGRRNGFDEGVDRELTRLAGDLDDPDAQTALVCYQTLNPTPVLEGWSLARAADRKSSMSVRCRALETLRFRDADDEALKELLRTLGGRDLELRRSAALALGELDHDRALDPLLTAAELEREPLARAFLLLSIGRQAGPRARDFLVDYVERGRKTHRAWAAIGLGILARQDDDAEARKVLLERFKYERNQNLRGAWYLALGIGQCEQAFDILSDGLVDGETPETRSAAAFGLAMVGGDEARELLLSRMTVDTCAYTRAVISQSLGFMGDRRDAPALVDTLLDISHPSLQPQLSLALGLHGSREALEGLVAVAKQEDAKPVTRAAALEAVQLLLGTGPNLTLGELLRQTNFAVFPPALVRHLTVPI